MRSAFFCIYLHNSPPTHFPEFSRIFPLSLIISAYFFFPLFSFSSALNQPHFLPILGIYAGTVAIEKFPSEEKRNLSWPLQIFVPSHKHECHVGQFFFQGLEELGCFSRTWTSEYYLFFIRARYQSMKRAIRPNIVVPVVLCYLLSMSFLFYLIYFCIIFNLFPAFSRIPFPPSFVPPLYCTPLLGIIFLGGEATKILRFFS